MFANKLLFLSLVLFSVNALAQRGNADSSKRMRYIQNQYIKVGIDLSLGGSITYIADIKKQENLVNNFDWGRQVQMSFYSGPVPFEPNNKKANKAWTFIGWNPIQSGDVAGNRSKVLDYKNTGKELYVKCIPMHWPLDNVPGECTYECWIKLDGKAVKVRSRILNNRPDTQQYTARTQELPAVYTNAPYHRLVTYRGSKPYTRDTTSVMQNHNLPGDSSIQWAQWQATECWAANVDENNYGLGVWNEGVQRFSGGYYGDNTFKGGSKDIATAYIAPNSIDVLDHNIDYAYNYVLFVGSIDEIRGYVYKNTLAHLPRYNFAKTRCQWSYDNTTDKGWPLQNSLQIYAKKNGALISPLTFWNASDAAKIVIKGSWPVGIKQARIYWQAHAEKGFVEPQSKAFDVVDDGEMHSYTVDLAGAEGYKGQITGIKILLNDNRDAGSVDVVTIASVNLAK